MDNALKLEISMKQTLLLLSIALVIVSCKSRGLNDVADTKGIFGSNGMTTDFSQLDPTLVEFTKRTAMRRPGITQELSNVVVFLASDESSYITGEAIEISGGAKLFTF